MEPIENNMIVANALFEFINALKALGYSDKQAYQIAEMTLEMVQEGTL